MMKFLKLMYAFASTCLIAATPPVYAQMADEELSSRINTPVSGNAQSAAIHALNPQPLPLTAFSYSVLRKIFGSLPAADRARLRATCKYMHQQGWRADKGRTAIQITEDKLGRNANQIILTPEGAHAIRHVRYPYHPLSDQDLATNVITGFRGLDMASLRTVKLEGVQRLDAETIAVFADALRNIPRLTTLDLSWSKFGHKGAEVLARPLDNMTNLKELNLGDNDFGPKGAEVLARPLGKMTNLRELNLRDNNFGPKGAECLTAVLPQMICLTTLDLRGNDFGPESAALLTRALGNMTNLRELNLRGNDFGPKGAEHLAWAFGNMTDLTTLNLGDNDLGPEGAEVLARALGNMTNLRSLLLPENKFGDVGAEVLARALGNMTSLRELSLFGNSFDPADQQLIRDAVAQLPQDVHIVF